MEWLTAELVQAFGIAIGSVIGAVTAWQAREVKKLRARVDALEMQAGEDHKLIRTAGRVIRSLLADRDALLHFISLHLPGIEPPTMRTVIPKEFDEKI
ncbi:hypothetical protein [Nocardia sp. CC201C]|uniref:hypothetical protein n=1 Tax=Nocardia sp. CC201C TaxID=3044575 RepID=UPI0024A7FCEC|nr:hypothetical protein [Nocardia sp. CC201C]